MRRFIAFHPHPVLKRLVAQRCAPHLSRPGVRWVAEELLHVTLVFLGEVDTARVPRVHEVMDEVAAAAAPLMLRLTTGGTFGTPLPRVLWLGLDGDLSPAAALQAALMSKLEVVDTHGGWRPHLTLARAKANRGDPVLADIAQALDATDLPPMPVDRLTLFESVDGHYRVAHEALLRGA